MQRHPPSSNRTRRIPNYAMYGDNAPAGGSNMFNFEWIPERSPLYDWEIDPHEHQSLIQILLMTEGQGNALLDDARWHLRAPALVVVPAGRVHGFEFNPQVNGVVVTAAQKPLEAMARIVMPELLSTLRKPLAINLPEQGRYTAGLMPLYLSIEREWRLAATGQVAAGLSLITTLLVQVARLNETLEPAIWPALSRKTLQLEKLRNLIDEHIRHRWSVAQYAEQLGISPGQLSRLTRESLGKSSIDLINERVLIEAQRELIYTNASIKQIADGLGFEDESYFGRFFRKHLGVSPQAYRVQELERLSQD
ncbi:MULTISPECIES: helix-turn-helix domain-containing protein [Comamonas]|uniref:Helix-turn-helix domain-containing protein n=1 Tax=Comamonas thiooxydans TaxID=363952 RepID=A0A7V8RNI6_9BURK|nr:MULTISPECIES: helix-turn-helix domain-containing protein [Comamonas]EFI62512.1 AraC family transcriptional regulator [Comamonas thiooxydans]KKI12381.1 transcriptional regulator [Comamonas thiooxydans]MDH1337372.1 helix-turn-helix domain-containing protein [Comamonas thiooxydans]MDH1743496.1 helix-turn-helix domain-containing protein [Comamonas thiooxydans]MDH1789838.1 helix-turn-helix domain-containing protein [Comamonas thiooxydans]